MKILQRLIVFGFMPAVGFAGSHTERNAERWAVASIPKHRLHEVQVIVARIEKHKARYQDVEKASGVPWHVIAALHNMESSGSFRHHLHEGSSLKWRTKYVPIGRPRPPAMPPFRWEVSAVDALAYDKMREKNWREIGPALTAVEFYNGTGYMKYHPSVPSPYLWAGTSVEKPGKYVADGKWSPTARSSQVGVAAVWKCLGK